MLGKQKNIRDTVSLPQLQVQLLLLPRTLTATATTRIIRSVLKTTTTKKQNFLMSKLLFKVSAFKISKISVHGAGKPQFFLKNLLCATGEKLHSALPEFVHLLSELFGGHILKLAVPTLVCVP